MLRILVVPPMYGGSLPIARYAADGLAELGHLVETFGAPGFHSAFEALKDLRVASDRLEYLENSFLQVVSQAILAKVERFEPDLVLALAQAPLSRQALKRLRKDGVATAMWFVEDFRLFTYWRAFAPRYDVFAVIQKEPFFAELQTIGQTNAVYLPLAAQPSFHRPLEQGPVERRKFGSDVSFMGAGYPNRRAAFRQLLQYDLKIWGSDWEGDPVLQKYVQLGGARVSPEDAVQIFNAAKINLNLHSSVQSKELVPPGDFVNPRTFELAGCGAFQLVDRRGLMGELFGPDELATFSCLDELRERIDHFLANPEERRTFAERGRARVLAEHTYVRRMQTLLDFTAQRLHDWPPRREQSSPAMAALPQELRPQLAELMDRLRLPREAGFAEVVESVRAQHGVLTELETAILFLDEWKKQYSRKSA